MKIVIVKNVFTIFLFMFLIICFPNLLSLDLAGYLGAQNVILFGLRVFEDIMSKIKFILYDYEPNASD